MAKTIMIQGTMSGVGKSLLAAGLCRIFSQDGYRTAPFKSQNMALNSYVTGSGEEMGRAQVMQAEAAGTEPIVLMNPILLKPNSDTGSQVIVMGHAIGDMSAREYYARKREMLPYIADAFNSLAAEYDIIVIEGAGSPAEINLKDNDIVNMGMAKLADAPVLIVGDIDRGGVFAQLLGTLNLLTSDERARVKGLVINKFRGDKTLLDSGVDILNTRGGVPVVGLVPYMDIRLEDEDSLSERLHSMGTKHGENTKSYAGQDEVIDIAVVRLMHISNYTDMDIFECLDNVRIRYVDRREDMKEPDMVIIPGSKNTTEDLKHLYAAGMADEIIRLAGRGCTVFGICGGMQMMGDCIYEDETARKEGRRDGTYRGLGLLPVYTVLGYEKTLRQVKDVTVNTSGILSSLNGCTITGYEIHEGRTYHSMGDAPVEALIGGDRTDGINAYGTYIHGFFDEGNTAHDVVKALSLYKGKRYTSGGISSYREYKEQQYDKLADILRGSLDMDRIYGMLCEAAYITP